MEVREWLLAACAMFTSTQAQHTQPSIRLNLNGISVWLNYRTESPCYSDCPGLTAKPGRLRA